jgi:hypothetical protein
MRSMQPAELDEKARPELIYNNRLDTDGHFEAQDSRPLSDVGFDLTTSARVARATFFVRTRMSEQGQQLPLHSTRLMAVFAFYRPEAAIPLPATIGQSALRPRQSFSHAGLLPKSRH